MPVSGRDRRFYKRELDRVRQLQKEFERQAAAARAQADDLRQRQNQFECQEWNARQFIGGPAAPSPTIAEAINGGCELIEAQCRRCGRTRRIDLCVIRRPRDQPIHTLENNLTCDACGGGDSPRWRASQINLVALCRRDAPDPTDLPAAAPAKR